MNLVPFSFMFIIFALFILFFSINILAFVQFLSFCNRVDNCHHASMGHETGRIIPTWYTAEGESIVLMFWCFVHIFFFHFLEYSVWKMSFVLFNQFYFEMLLFSSPPSPHIRPLRRWSIIPRWDRGLSYYGGSTCTSVCLLFIFICN